jgi:hypothetical protein
MDHPLFLCYERVYFLGMKLFIDLWTLLLPCGDSELLFVGNTCFFYLEKLLRSSNNIKEFVDLMSLDVQTIRNQYLEFQVQKKRYSSRPAAQRIQKSVQEQLPTVFYNMAVHYLTIGHWFDAKPGGSIFIQLQESEFWYGHFHVRNPHIGLGDLSYTSIVY